VLPFSGRRQLFSSVDSPTVFLLPGGSLTRVANKVSSPPSGEGRGQIDLQKTVVIKTTNTLSHSHVSEAFRLPKGQDLSVLSNEFIIKTLTFLSNGAHGRSGRDGALPDDGWETIQPSEACTDQAGERSVQKVPCVELRTLQ
jgi:hypothetical protein